MMDALIAAALIGTLVLGPLAWRVRHDRQTERKLRLRANLDTALRHALGGDSFVSLDVVPSTAWRRGRVILYTPAGFSWLIEQAWERVAEHTPPGYDLVIRGAAASSARETTPLKAAA